MLVLCSAGAIVVGTTARLLPIKVRFMDLCKCGSKMPLVQAAA